MKAFLFALAFLAIYAKAVPDLYAPFAVDLKSSRPSAWDTIIVTSFLANKGTTGTRPMTFDWGAMDIYIDSFFVASHRFPANYVLNAGYFIEYSDTVRVLKGAFAVSSWSDPLLFSGEGGGETVNNVRSQAFNFHPTILRDTVVLYDTLRLHDTLKIVQKDTIKINMHDTVRVSIHDTITRSDTVRVTIRDTVIKKDTVKICPSPGLAKVGIQRPVIASQVYNAIGQPVWSGMLPEGDYPPVRLKQGLHLLVQGARVHRFRVAYR